MTKRPAHVPISQEFDSIGHYLARNLSATPTADEAPTRQVNARLSLAAYDFLAELADDLGKSKSAVAADLLELALAEAYDCLHPKPAKEKTE